MSRVLRVEKLNLEKLEVDILKASGTICLSLYCLKVIGHELQDIILYIRAVLH